MAMDKYSKLELDFKGIGGAMRFTGQEAVSLQKQFRLLKQELTLGSYTEEQFTQIRNALQEVEIKLKQSQIRGKEFFEQIGTLGGPIGELSNRVSRAISLFAALNEMSFDELKSQFENISKILAGSVEDISAGISTIKSGGRAEGVKESTGNAGEAGRGLDTVNTVANVANADAITKVAEATKLKTTATLEDIVVSKEQIKATSTQNTLNSKFKFITDEQTAANSKFIYSEEEVLRQQKAFIGLSKSKKKDLQELYDATLLAANTNHKMVMQMSADDATLEESKALLEQELKGVTVTIVGQTLAIKGEGFAIRELSAEELALIATNQALALSNDNVVITEVAKAAAIKKATLAAERAASINKVFTTFLNAGAGIANSYNGAVRFLATRFGTLAVATTAATVAIQGLFLVIGAGIAIGLVRLMGGLKETITGFAKSAAAAENLKIQLENINEVLDLNLAAIKRRNAEEIAEMKVKNATSQQLREKDLEGVINNWYEIGLQLEEAKMLEAKALGDFGPAKKAIEDRFKKEKTLYAEGSAELLDARELFIRDLNQLNFEQNKYNGGFFGLTEEAATQQADNIKKSGKLVLTLQEKQIEAVNDLQVKGNANIEATERNSINNRIKAIDAQMEQEIYSTETSSKELVRLNKERNSLIDYLDKDHKLTLVERNERTRIQNQKNNNFLIDDEVRVIQARIDAQQRLVEGAAKGSEEEFEARKELAQENFNKEMAEAKRNEQTREQNEKNALNKKVKALRDINISELTASEDLQQTFLNGAIKGLESYYDTQVELENTSYKKRQAEFSGNAKKLEALEKEHTQKLQDIQVQRLASRKDLIQHFLNAESQNTVYYFDLQRDLENAAYVEQQEAAKGNYELLRALRLEHLRKMDLIDASEFENKAQLLDRRSKTEFQDQKNKDEYTILSLFDKNNVLRTINEKAYQDQVQSEEINYEAQKLKAGTNKEALTQIELEHLQVLRDLGAQKIETEQQVNLMIEQLGVQFGSTLSNIGNMLLQDAQGRDEKKFKSAKKMAIAGIGIEKASAIASIWTNNYIANAKARATFWATGGQPFVTINTISSILNTAATIAAAAQAMSAINGTDFVSPDKGSGRHYAMGGMIGGARHSDGGVPIEAEGGEAVMTRGAVTAFAPLLSMLNVAGGGTSFSQGAVGQAGYDNPTRDGQQLQQQQITKTYVVEQELTTMQQRQARLKNLSTL